MNWFVHYPYQYPVGQLGITYAGTTALDATTHFLTRPMESKPLGCRGGSAIAFFCAFVFWVLDSAAQRHDPRLAALITTYAAYNLSNISISRHCFPAASAFLLRCCIC